MLVTCNNVNHILFVFRRELREKRFVSAVENIVSGGGSCLIPVFALGRAQELLLILEEFWRENPKFQVKTIVFSYDVVYLIENISLVCLLFSEFLFILLLI